MASRAARLSKTDAQGHYVRQIGWKLNSSGKRVQHKFRLGSDRRQAERRDQQLRVLWDSLVAWHADQQPLWDEQALQIAKQIARGADPIELEPESDSENADDYAVRVGTAQTRFPFLRIVAVDQKRFASSRIGQFRFRNGQIQHPETVLLHSEVIHDQWSPGAGTPGYSDEQRPRRTVSSVVNSADLIPLASPGVVHKPSQASVVLTESAHPPAGRLHEAFDAYIEWIREEYIEAGEVTDYGLTKSRQVMTLRERHEDVALDGIGFEEVERMYRYWRQRPFRKAGETTATRMSRSSVRHYLGELHRFFKWLHRSPRFGWQVPENFESISRTIPRDTDKVKQSIREVSTFQLEELRLLNRFATPQERLYLLLALNCGFGAKEIATLTIGEVLLHQALSEREQELFSFPSSSADSFVSVVRSKTTIPGKYILFPQTVQMLEWSMSRRLTQPNPTADEPLILNSKGRRLDARTIAGNASQQIPNSFARLKKRVSQNGGHISNLPFKCLRKTAGDLIRRFSDGEISGVFLMHGQPVDSDHLSDVYTHRPFGKVFRSIQRVQKFLEPVFEDVAGDPTDDQGNGGKTRIARKAVAELRIQGLSVREISEITGRSKTSVHRDIQRLTDQADVK